MKPKANHMGISARSVLGVVCVFLVLLLGFNFSPAALQRASSTMNLPHDDAAEEVTEEVRLELAREGEVKLRPRKPLETSTSPRLPPPATTSTQRQSRPPHDQQMSSSSPPSAVFSVGESRDIGYYFGAGGLTKRFGSTLSSSLKLTKAHLNNGMVAPFAPAAEPLHDREDGARGVPQRYPNHTGLLHIDPTLPFPAHEKEEFLVAVGVMTMDSAYGAKRRKLIRNTWMTYSSVWSPTRQSGNVLVKFVLGRLETNEFQFTPTLQAEARNTSYLSDIVALSLHERKSSMGKSDSTKYGLWGLDSMLSTAFKALVWRRLAIAMYATLFVAKADDDVFVNIPQYVATLRVLPIKRTSWGLHALAQREPGHANTSFPYCLGPLSTMSSDLAHVATSSEIADLLSLPYNGRPSDYYSRRCDHEDYSCYSAIDAAAAATTTSSEGANETIHIFHDCRFIEPFLQGEGFNTPAALVQLEASRNNASVAPPFRPPTLRSSGTLTFSPQKLAPHQFVNLHKLDKSLFAAARQWFTDDDAHQQQHQHVNFISHPSPDLPAGRYQWHSAQDALMNRCGPLFSAGYHTRWGELGPMKFFLRREGELHPCPFQHLGKLTSPILLALGVWTSSPQERIHIRKLLRDVPNVWSWFNRTTVSSSSSLLVRFPIFSDAASISLDEYWECHRYQDMIALNTKKWNLGATTSTTTTALSSLPKRYMWALTAKRLYPTAQYIAVLENNILPPALNGWNAASTTTISTLLATITAKAAAQHDQSSNRLASSSSSLSPPSCWKWVSLNISYNGSCGGSDAKPTNCHEHVLIVARQAVQRIANRVCG